MTPGPKSKRKYGHYQWPSDLEFLVLLWEMTQDEIAAMLGCRQTTVSSHALKLGFETPDSEYWRMKKLGLPVEVPDAVKQARVTFANGSNPGVESVGMPSDIVTKALEQVGGFPEPAARPESKTAALKGAAPPLPPTLTLEVDIFGPNLVYIGIDNGYTGAAARIGINGELVFRPVAVSNLGGHKELDIDGNIEMLQDLIASSGARPEQTLVVVERGQVGRDFGAHNNFVNGQNHEFWRVVLSRSKIPFAWVNPKTWQKIIFRGLGGTDTKAVAALACRQRFPELNLRGYNRSQREGIHDAICIALWARQTLR